MKEDLAISKNNLLSLYEENRQLKLELGKDVSKDIIQKNNLPKGEIKIIDSSEVEELQYRLEEERRLRLDAEKELELQVTSHLVIVLVLH